jgi:hypothetical protein
MVRLPKDIPFPTCLFRANGVDSEDPYSRHNDPSCLGLGDGVSKPTDVVMTIEKETTSPGACAACCEVKITTEETSVKTCV